MIAKLRKDAGYTQKALAEALCVTDKAVSKWERGLCLPDSGLLTKLSMILDADIEYLIDGKTPYGEHEWVGELRVKDLKGTIAGKPLVHYLLSYFMLAGIKDIAIITDDRDYIRNMDLSQYGLNISYTSMGARRTMLVYDKFLLFGVNITRQLQYCMLVDENIGMILHERKIPIVFSKGVLINYSDKSLKEIGMKSLGRGTIYIPLGTEEEMEDASRFVDIYERYNRMKIADLNEIAKLRRLVWQNDFKSKL